APQIFESKAEIKWDVCHSEILFVRRKLRSILYNLVNNSIKYRDSDRTLKIDIKVYLENEFIVIVVADNGRGIEEQNLAKIFTKYERLSNDVEGAGVGLHLVREIVSLTGGRISVESQLKKGTVFKIYLKNKNV